MVVYAAFRRFLLNIYETMGFTMNNSNQKKSNDMQNVLMKRFHNAVYNNWEEIFYDDQ